MSGRPLFLIGHMACGKTTLGRALSARGGIDFIDLDAEIECKAGMSVAEIFATQGEAAFRAIETDTLRSVIADMGGRRVVVACGGGTPCRGSNMEAMLAAGDVVWLRADRDVTLRRIAEAAEVRPRLRGLSSAGIAEFMEREACDRDPVYSRAGSTFDSSRLDTAEEIKQTTDLFLTQYF